MYKQVDDATVEQTLQMVQQMDKKTVKWFMMTCAKLKRTVGDPAMKAYGVLDKKTGGYAKYIAGLLALVVLGFILYITYIIIMIILRATVGRMLGWNTAATPAVEPSSYEAGMAAGLAAAAGGGGEAGMAQENQHGASVGGGGEDEFSEVRTYRARVGVRVV